MSPRKTEEVDEDAPATVDAPSTDSVPAEALDQADFQANINTDKYPESAYATAQVPPPSPDTGPDAEG